MVPLMSLDLILLLFSLVQTEVPLSKIIKQWPQHEDNR